MKLVVKLEPAGTTLSNSQCTFFCRQSVSFALLVYKKDVFFSLYSPRGRPFLHRFFSDHHKRTHQSRSRPSSRLFSSSPFSPRFISLSFLIDQEFLNQKVFVIFEKYVRGAFPLDADSFDCGQTAHFFAGHYKIANQEEPFPHWHQKNHCIWFSGSCVRGLGTGVTTPTPALFLNYDLWYEKITFWAIFQLVLQEETFIHFPTKNLFDWFTGSCVSWPQRGHTHWPL